MFSSSDLKHCILLSTENEADFDLNGAFSPSESTFRVLQLSPDPFLRPHSSSLSSESGYSRSDNMSFHGDEEVSGQFYYTPSADTTPFYPTSEAPVADINHYVYTDDFSHFDQSQWGLSSVYSQQPSHPTFTNDLPPSIYPSFEPASSLSNANIIPPTPESPGQTLFNFNGAPQMTQGFLAASPAMSQSRSMDRSRTGSIGSMSRSTSPASNLSSSPSFASLQGYGTLVSQSLSSPQTWRCAFPGCTSRALFTRGCDLRKHYNRHSKHLFCRIEGCPQSAPQDLGDRRGSISGSVGFSSKKDRARHEAKHNPGIRCEWRSQGGEACGRVFSRVDNMKDHVRRIHRKGSR